MPLLQAATAQLHCLNARLVKAKHELHTNSCKVDAIRAECDKARHTVEENDAATAAMEQEEQRLKLAYVEGKLTYEKVGALRVAVWRWPRLKIHHPPPAVSQAHAEKYARQQELKQLRAERQASLPGLGGTSRMGWARVRAGAGFSGPAPAAPQAVVRDRDGAAGALATRQTEWVRCQRQHQRLDEGAEALSAKLEVCARQSTRAALDAVPQSTCAPPLPGGGAREALPPEAAARAPRRGRSLFRGV